MDKLFRVLKTTRPYLVDGSNLKCFNVKDVRCGRYLQGPICPKIKTNISYDPNVVVPSNNCKETCGKGCIAFKGVHRKPMYGIYTDLQLGRISHNEYMDREREESQVEALKKEIQFFKGSNIVPYPLSKYVIHEMHNRFNRRPPTDKKIHKFLIEDILLTDIVTDFSINSNGKSYSILASSSVSKKEFNEEDCDEILLGNIPHNDNIQWYIYKDDDKFVNEMVFYLDKDLFNLRTEYLKDTTEMMNKIKRVIPWQMYNEDNLKMLRLIYNKYDN